MSGAPIDVRDLEDSAAMLEADGSYRVLRRAEAPAPGLRSGSLPDAATRVVCVADVETAGLDPEGPIIELALRRLRVDADGEIVEVGKPYAFLEDPGAPLPPAIVALTGLTDADLSGRSIDVGTATALLRSSDVVACHNARFDAPRITGRLPALHGHPFACSFSEVDWRARGVAGPLKLGCLLCQHRLFAPDAHRAGADVDATIALLALRDASGRTAMAEMLETAAHPTLRFSAYGAAFGEPKDALKARGYRWDADARVWSREIPSDGRDEETAWLDEHVYATRWNPKCAGPQVETVDWSTRHG